MQPAVGGSRLPHPGLIRLAAGTSGSATALSVSPGTAASTLPIMQQWGQAARAALPNTAALSAKLAQPQQQGQAASSAATWLGAWGAVLSAASATAPAGVVARAPLPATGHQLAAGASGQWGALSSLRQQASKVPSTLLQVAMGQAIAGPGAAAAGSSSAVSEADAIQQCASALVEAAQTAQHAHMEDTVKARHRHTALFASFLERLPPSMGVNLLTAGPEHLLWYAQQEFIKEHAGRWSGRGFRSRLAWGMPLPTNNPHAMPRPPMADCVVKLPRLH